MGRARQHTADRPKTGRGVRISALGITGGLVAAFAVAVPAQAAVEFIDAPTRLYLLPNADGPLPAPIPFPLVPDGVLLFDDSQDLLSQDLRTLEVASEDPDCDFGPAYDLTGCTAIQLDVGHGLLDFTTAPSRREFDPNPDDGIDETDVVYELPGGALVRDMDSDDDLPAKVTALIGTTAQVNDGLDLLRYIPDEDYYYNGSNPETLSVDIVPGSGSGSVTHDIEVRVLDVNDFPEITVPQTLYSVEPGAEIPLSPPGAWEVADEDNDEETDGEDPPGSGDDPIDGTGEEFILIAWASCGVFHFQGASGMTLRDDLEELLDYALDLGSIDPAWRDTIMTAFLEVVPDDIEELPFATGNPNDYATAFAGVVDDVEWLNYHLDEIMFQAVTDPVANTPLGDGVCDVRFLVTDIGNNGLPLQYLGDPPEGVEVPFFGFDIDTNDAPGVELVQVQVGEGQQVEVSLGDATVPEGGASTVPVTISPAEHPAFELTVSTADGTDAAADVDYTSKSDVVVQIPENAASASVPVDALQDPDYDPGETYLVTATAPASDPPGHPVTLADPTGTVTIEDDDPEPDSTAPTVTIDQATGQADPTTTLPITFDVVFSEPVTGFDPGDVTLTGAGSGSLAITGTGATYTVTVDDLVGNRTITATIPAGAAQDTAGNTSDASTSTDNTVTYEPDDVTPPTVTIDQATGQADPTSVAPVVFSVVFSEPVTGFQTGDVLLSGTADPASAQVVPVSPTEYTVNVAGMTGAGTVIASVPAGAAEDDAGNLNAASTSADNTVQWQVDEPEVNDPPVLTLPPALVTLVDTLVAVPASVADPDVGAGLMEIQLDIVAIGGAVTADGTLTWPHGAGVTSDVFVGTLAEVNAALAALEFTPGAGQTGVARLVAEIDDQGNAGTGGTLSHTRFVDITIEEESSPGDPLTIDAPDDIVVDAPPGQPGVSVTFAPPTTSGGVPPVSVGCDHGSGEVYPIGVTTVTCTATDSAPDELVVLFAVVSDSFTITVNATVDPGEPGGGTPGGGTPGGGTPGGGTPGGGTPGGGTGGTGTTGALSATGADPWPPMLLAMALLLAGFVIVRVGRRRAG